MLSSVIQQSGQGPGIPGVPQLVAKADLTAQGANVPLTTFYTIPAGHGGMYRFSYYAVVTQAATTSSTLPQGEFNFTDADTGVATANVIGAASTANTVGACSAHAQSPTWPDDVIINAQAGTVIQYGTIGYLSSGATPMQFALHVKLEYLGA